VYRASIGNQLDALMPQTVGAPITYEERHETVPPLKPVLASINAARAYMGGPSRSKFYADILPLLDTVKFGNRNFVVVKSMDRLIEARRSEAV
jgi:hypothetical protein